MVRHARHTVLCPWGSVPVSQPEAKGRVNVHNTDCQAVKELGVPPKGTGIQVEPLGLLGLRGVIHKALVGITAHSLRQGSAGARRNSITGFDEGSGDLKILAALISLGKIEPHTAYPIIIQHWESIHSLRPILFAPPLACLALDQIVELDGLGALACARKGECLVDQTRHQLMDLFSIQRLDELEGICCHSPFLLGALP